MIRLALPLLLTAFGSLQAVEIIAHRGASHDAPENTLAAFHLGFGKQQADACELDTYLTADGQAVVLHDANLKRTTGVDLLVKNATLADLAKLEAGAWKHERFRGEKVPTLAEALAIIPRGRRMFLEIKCGPEILPALVRVVQASGRAPAQLPIICFKLEVVRQAKALLPAHEVSFLAASRPDPRTGHAPALEELIAKAKAAAADGLDLHHGFPIDAAFVARVHAAGLKLYVWTVNDPTLARRLATAGVDGITTDRPALLRESLR